MSKLEFIYAKSAFDFCKTYDTINLSKAECKTNYQFILFIKSFNCFF